MPGPADVETSQTKLTVEHSWPSTVANTLFEYSDERGASQLYSSWGMLLVLPYSRAFLLSLRQLSIRLPGDGTTGHFWLRDSSLIYRVPLGSAWAESQAWFLTSLFGSWNYNWASSTSKGMVAVGEAELTLLLLHVVYSFMIPVILWKLDVFQEKFFYPVFQFLLSEY